MRCLTRKSLPTPEHVCGPPSPPSMIQVSSRATATPSSRAPSSPARPGCRTVRATQRGVAALRAGTRVVRSLKTTPVSPGGVAVVTSDAPDRRRAPHRERSSPRARGGLKGIEADLLHLWGDGLFTDGQFEPAYDKLIEAETSRRPPATSRNSAPSTTAWAASIAVRDRSTPLSAIN